MRCMLSLLLARGTDLGIRGGGGLTVEDAFRRTGRLKLRSKSAHIATADQKVRYQCPRFEGPQRGSRQQPLQRPARSRCAPSF
jgi:hypothetical protein